MSKTLDEPLTHVNEERAKRVGLTNVETAEKRRRHAEIVWLNAQNKAKIAALELDAEAPLTTPRERADKELEIAKIRMEIATLRHEAAYLKADLADDKAHFPR